MTSIGKNCYTDRMVIDDDIVLKSLPSGKYLVSKEGGKLSYTDSTPITSTGDETIDGIKTFTSTIVGTIDQANKLTNKLNIGSNLSLASGEDEWNADTEDTINLDLDLSSYARKDQANSFSGTQTFVQKIVGNIDTANKLKNPRTIAGVSFDGSSNIDIPSSGLQDSNNICLLDNTQTITGSKTFESTNNQEIIPTELYYDLSWGQSSLFTGYAPSIKFNDNQLWFRSKDNNNLTSYHFSTMLSGDSLYGQTGYLKLDVHSTEGVRFYAIGKDWDESGVPDMGFVSQTKQYLFDGGVGGNDIYIDVGSMEIAKYSNNVKQSNGITFNGNVTGSSASCSGNALTATTLETARNIAGQSFNGSADITIASTNLSDSVDLIRNTGNQTINGDLQVNGLKAGSTNFRIKNNAENVTHYEIDDTTGVITQIVGTSALNKYFKMGMVTSGSLYSTLANRVFLETESQLIFGNTASNLNDIWAGHAFLEGLDIMKTSGVPYLYFTNQNNYIYRIAGGTASNDFIISKYNDPDSGEGSCEWFVYDESLALLQLKLGKLTDEKNFTFGVATAGTHDGKQYLKTENDELLLGDSASNLKDLICGKINSKNEFGYGIKIVDGSNNVPVVFGETPDYVLNEGGTMAVVAGSSTSSRRFNIYNTSTGNAIIKIGNTEGIYGIVINNNEFKLYQYSGSGSYALIVDSSKNFDFQAGNLTTTGNLTVADITMDNIVYSGNDVIHIKKDVQGGYPILRGCFIAPTTMSHTFDGTHPQYHLVGGSSNKVYGYSNALYSQNNIIFGSSMEVGADTGTLSMYNTSNVSVATQPDGEKSINNAIFGSTHYVNRGKTGTQNILSASLNHSPQNETIYSLVNGYFHGVSNLQYSYVGGYGNIVGCLNPYHLSQYAYPVTSYSIIHGFRIGEDCPITCYYSAIFGRSHRTTLKNESTRSPATTGFYTPRRTVYTLMSGYNHTAKHDGVTLLGYSQTSNATGALQTSGEIWCDGGTVNSSDRRVKKDIVDASLDNSYDIIKNLKVRKYKYTDNYRKSLLDNPSSEEVWGFIAQEVEEFYPDAVKTTPEKELFEPPEDNDNPDDVKTPVLLETIPDFKSLEKQKLMYPMVGAIQKLMEKIETLENEIKILKENK